MSEALSEWTVSEDEWTRDRLPSITPERVRQAESEVALFEDDLWLLQPLGTSSNARSATLNFATISPSFRPTVKRLVWLNINTPTPDDLMNAQRARSEWASAVAVHGMFTALRDLTTWLEEQHPVQRLSHVTEHMLERYAMHQEDRIAKAGRRKGSKIRQTTVEGSLRRLHLAYALSQHLPWEHQLVRPPWLDERPPRRTGERRMGNQTDELSPDIYGPLIVWASKFVMDFAGDIMAANDRYQELNARPTPPYRTALAGAIVEEWLSDHQTLPGERTMVVDGVPRVNLGGSYLANRAGGVTSYQSIGDYVRKHHAEVPVIAGTAPLGVAITGTVEHRLWLPDIDYYEATDWVGRLRDACMIVIGFGTALRPHELLSLSVNQEGRDGTLRPTVEQATWPNGQRRWLIHGRLYKGQRSLNGEALLGGVPVTWDTTQLGAKAIQVATAIAGDSPWLFPSLHRGRGSLEQPMTTGKSQDRIAMFVDRVNQIVLDEGLPDAYRIPVDPDRPIMPSQFRRTAIAMIEDQPKGLLAAAHQAKHLVGDVIDTRVTEGYGDISKQGQLVHERRAALSVEAATDLALAVAVRGDGISGPALSRAMQVVSEVGGALMRLSSRREAERVARRSGQKIYRSPRAIGWCVHQRTTAACGDGEEPDLGACQLSCSNLVRTDGDIAGVELKIASLEAEARLLPKPAGDRKTRLAERYRRIVSDHEARVVQVEVSEGGGHDA